MSIVKPFIKAFGLAALVANSGWALPTLDPTFGTHGVATAEFSEPFSSLSETHAIGVLPDGRILLAGSGNFIPTAASASEWTVIFARLLTHGQRDESFGPGGIKHVPLTGFAAAAGVTPEGIAIERGIALPGGRVLLGGSLSTDWRLPSVPMMGRFSTEGELDPSFAGQGLALLNLDWPSGWAKPAATSFAMQSDGGIVLLVRGTLQGTGRVSNSAWLLRLDSSGQLDTSFGSEGRAEITMDAPIQSDRVLVEPGSQGGILVALGFRESLPPRQGVRVMRFDGRGSRDQSYGDGENGQITILPAADPQPVSIRGADMQPDGRPVLLVSIPFRSDAVVVRLDPTGQPDADFGVNGSFWFQDTAGSRTGAGLRVDGDSGLLFAGSLGSAGSSQTLRLSRLQPDGEPDLAYTQSPWPGGEEPGLFESRPLTEFDNFSVTTLAPDASQRVLLAGNSLRQIVVGQDESGADIVESRKGFLVARIAEEVLPVLGFSLANYSIREGDGVQIDGQRSVALTVRRQGQLDQAVTFGYRAFSRPDDTATSGEDYLAVERQATLLAGWTGMQIYVPVLLDSLPEESETFSVELFAVDPGVSIEPGRASARVTILDGRTGISVTKRVSDGSAWRMPDSSVEYAVEVTNWGPLDSGELRAEADVPLPLLRLPGMSLSASQGTATYQLGGSKFVWEVGSLAVGRSARMNYQLYVPALPEPRRIESEARVEVLSGPPDNNPDNNTNRTFLVVGGADLRADYTTYAPTNRIVVVVRNQGPGTAGEFVVQTWADENFRAYSPATTEGDQHWDRVDGKWTLTHSSGLPAGQILSGDRLGAPTAMHFRANLKTNVTAGTITIEVTPLGTGDQADPVSANNRIEIVKRSPAPAASGPFGELSVEWANCVAANVSHYRNISGDPDPASYSPNRAGAAFLRRADADGLPSVPTGLAAYRGLRELMRLTHGGQRWVELYEQHTAELSQVLLQRLLDPGFLQDAVLFLGEFEQGCTSYLGGSGSGEDITQPMIDRLNRLADRFSELGSPELRAAIETERARFNHLQDFVGVSFADWGEMLGLEVPESPWLVASGARQLADGALLFEVNHVSGHHYTVWLTPSLDSAEWAPVAEADVQVLGNTVQVRVPNPSHPAEFYRVRAVAGVANQEPR